MTWLPPLGCELHSGRMIDARRRAKEGAFTDVAPASNGGFQGPGDGGLPAATKKGRPASGPAFASARQERHARSLESTGGRVGLGDDADLDARDARGARL
ncbi:MAG: hypothetical protein ACJ8GJ_25570, partial [Vitreoscilla sp.]